jgi:kynurenine formamidase
MAEPKVNRPASELTLDELVEEGRVVATVTEVEGFLEEEAALDAAEEAELAADVVALLDSVAELEEDSVELEADALEVTVEVMVN